MLKKKSGTQRGRPIVNISGPLVELERQFEKKEKNGPIDFFYTASKQANKV